MKQQLLTAIRRHRLWEPGMRVTVAISGGADSMALLWLLTQTRGLHGGVLDAVTVDHGLWEGSRGMAERAVTQASSLGLSARLLIAAPANRSEAAARRARYALLDGLDTDRVALGHHRRDQAETVLIHLMRGTGPRGLGGMPRRRGRYVRPVLDVDPARLAEVLVEADITPDEDPTNADGTYLRNRVRSQLLPLLETLREGAVPALARSAERSAEDDQFLRRLALELPSSLAAVAAAPRVLAWRRVQELLHSATTRQIDEVLAAIVRGDGAVELGEGRKAVVSGGRLTLAETGGAKTTLLG